MGLLDARDEREEALMASMWAHVDWKEAETKLASLQRRLTVAARRRQWHRVRVLQDRIVEDLDIRCLAVRDIASPIPRPGPDNVVWKTPADFFRGACSLRAEGYHAWPLRRIIHDPRGDGRERAADIPVYRDKAMLKLYSYVLQPVLEASADGTSFAFRKGRSTHDAHEYLRLALSGHAAPRWVVVADIEKFYSNISHNVLMGYLPMDKRVLREFLDAGILFAGILFPTDDAGISEGSSLSPSMANFMLDGLQRRIYATLHLSANDYDRREGLLIRFADDIVVTTRYEWQAHVALGAIRGFLAERGLALSPTKTRICEVGEGFDFLGRTYRLENNRISCVPTRHVVERFLGGVEKWVRTFRGSQRSLIERLNAKLRGWGNYHRFGDARETFREVDERLQHILLAFLIARHPRKRVRELFRRYFVEESGFYYFALPNEPQTHVIRLQDLQLERHLCVQVDFNPFTEPTSLKDLRKARQIQNRSGPYGGVWRGQGRVCHHCGRPILVDQRKYLTGADPRITADTVAYAHERCREFRPEVIATVDPLTGFDPESLLEVVREADGLDVGPMTHAKLPRRWPYLPLKRHLARADADELTLTFKQIEAILGRSLPRSARSGSRFWYLRSDGKACIANAWETEGYELGGVWPEREAIRLVRVARDYLGGAIPRVILETKIPDDAVFEVEQFLDHIIAENNLKGRR